MQQVVNSIASALRERRLKRSKTTGGCHTRHAPCSFPILTRKTHGDPAGRRADGSADTYIHDEFLKEVSGYLEDRAQGNQPFFLHYAALIPHASLVAPRRRSGKRSESSNFGPTGLKPECRRGRPSLQPACTTIVEGGRQAGRWRSHGALGRRKESRRIDSPTR